MDAEKRARKRVIVWFVEASSFDDEVASNPGELSINRTESSRVAVGSWPDRAAPLLKEPVEVRRLLGNRNRPVPHRPLSLRVKGSMPVRKPSMSTRFRLERN